MQLKVWIKTERRNKENLKACLDLGHVKFTLSYLKLPILRQWIFTILTCQGPFSYKTSRSLVENWLSTLMLSTPWVHEHEHEHEHGWPCEKRLNSNELPLILPLRASSMLNPTPCNSLYGVFPKKEKQKQKAIRILREWAIRFPRIHNLTRITVKIPGSRLKVPKFFQCTSCRRPSTRAQRGKHHVTCANWSSWCETPPPPWNPWIVPICSKAACGETYIARKCIQGLFIRRVFVCWNGSNGRWGSNSRKKDKVH